MRSDKAPPSKSQISVPHQEGTLKFYNVLMYKKGLLVNSESFFMQKNKVHKFI